MHKKDLIFMISFVGSLSVLLIIIGSAISGMVTQSQICDEDGCSTICRYDQDCSYGEICCDEGIIGVCKNACDNPFVFKPAFDPVLPIPVVEKPLPAVQLPLMLYIFLTMAIVGIGVVYLLLRKKHLIH